MNCWFDGRKYKRIYIIAFYVFNMRSIVPLVVLLVVLAGCSGAPAGGTTTTAASMTYPDGLSGSGIHDAYELADTHRAALQGQSFQRERHTRIVRAEDGVMLVNQSVAGTWRANRSWFAVQYELDVAPWGIYGAQNGTISYYANGSVVAVHQEVPAEGFETSRLVTEPQGTPTPPTAFDTSIFGTPTATRLLAARYQAVQPGSVTRTATGYRIEADSTGASQIDFGRLPVTNVSDVSFTANLTTEGIVRSYELEVAGELNGTRVTASESVTVSRIGEADVSEPSWFGAAVAK